MNRKFESKTHQDIERAEPKRPPLLAELQDDLLAFVVRAVLLGLGIVAVGFAAVVAAALSVVLVPLLVLSGGRHQGWRQTWLGRLRGALGPRSSAARRLHV